MEAVSSPGTTARQLGDNYHLLNGPLLDSLQHSVTWDQRINFFNPRISVSNLCPPSTKPKQQTFTSENPSFFFAHTQSRGPKSVYAKPSAFSPISSFMPTSFASHLFLHTHLHVKTSQSCI